MRNRLPIVPGKEDQILRAASVLVIVITFILPAFYYSALPADIPVHFGIDGRPDRFSDKIWIWLSPVFGLIVYGGLELISQYPHSFSYPVQIDPKKSRTAQFLVTRMIRWLGLSITLVFLYITFSTIKIALDGATGLNIFIMSALVSPVIFISIIYLYKINRLKNPRN